MSGSRSNTFPGPRGSGADPPRPRHGSGSSTPAGAYIYLLGAGAVAIDGWLAARAGRLRRLLLATAVTTAVAVPLVLPVLPAGDVGWTQKINPVLAESVGWPQLAGTVRTAWFSLPASQRASTVRSRAGPADLSRRASQDGGRRWRGAGVDGSVSFPLGPAAASAARLRSGGGWLRQPPDVLSRLAGTVR